MLGAKINGAKTCVFDAYGTLFDVHSTADKCHADLGNKADQTSNTRPGKALQYSWLHSLMDEFIKLWQVTREAFDYTLSASGNRDAALH
jgi:2-haloacid dehalogenase